MKNNKKIVAIHQPNFFPWLGYFDKIIKSDIFVFLDKVQYTKGSWINRVKIINQGEPKWITCPASFNLGQSIREVKITDIEWFSSKLIRTINFNYSKAPFYNNVSPIIFEMIGCTELNLSENNIRIIKNLCDLLDIKINFKLQSELKTEKSSTDLLIEIINSVSGNSYLCGGGATDYQEDEKFTESGIELIYQNYEHPFYNQLNTSSFVPGLSIIDVLMNCGIEGTKDLLYKSSNKS